MHTETSKTLNFTTIDRQIKVKHCFKIQLITFFLLHKFMPCFHVLKHSAEKQGSKDRISTCIIVVSMTLKSTWICCEKKDMFKKESSFLFDFAKKITFCYKVKFKLFFNKSEPQRLFLENMRFNTAWINPLTVWGNFILVSCLESNIFLERLSLVLIYSLKCMLK